MANTTCTTMCERVRPNEMQTGTPHATTATPLRGPTHESERQTRLRVQSRVIGGNAVGPADPRRPLGMNERGFGAARPGRPPPPRARPVTFIMTLDIGSKRPPSTMQALTLVVLLTLGVAVRGSLLAAPLALAQPAHHPALVLDPHGRPLDTAEVISARALHLNAKALEHYAPAHIVAAPLAHAYAAPLLGAHSAYGLAGHGHFLKKRSLGHLAYGAPLVHSAVVPAVVAAPAAVSHQSRVDVHSSPAIVAAPVVAAPVVAAHSVLAAPAHGFYSALGLGAHGLGAHGLGVHGLGAHGHFLKKRSLGHLAYAAPVYAPAAVSHQARVDVISSPAVVSHAVAAPAVVAAPALVAAPAAVSHQSRVDVRTSPAVVAHAALPLAHSAVLAAPAAHLAHSGLLHASPYLHHAW